MGRPSIELFIPVLIMAILAAILVPRALQRRAPTFAQCAAFFERHWPKLLFGRSHNSSIEPVKLGVFAFPNAQLGFEARQPPSQQRVIENG